MRVLFSLRTHHQASAVGQFLRRRLPAVRHAKRDVVALVAVRLEIGGIGGKRRHGGIPNLSFVEADATALPFGDEEFDTVTISFGLRNVTDVAAALRDAHRLLKPGGLFMCLEFSHVKAEPLRSIYEMYSFNVIPALGEAVARDRASYQYLVESIRKFPKQEELAASMIDAGFASVTHENLTGGVVAIHSGFKSA